MTALFHSGPATPSRREFIGRLGRLILQGTVGASLWRIGAAAAETPGRIPPLDAAVPSDLRTAAFGLG